MNRHKRRLSSKIAGWLVNMHSRTLYIINTLSYERG